MKHRFDEIANSTITAAIDEWIHNAKHRAILKDKLVNGLTFEELAEAHDISVRHAQNIVYKAEDKLFSHLPI